MFLLIPAMIVAALASASVSTWATLQAQGSSDAAAAQLVENAQSIRRAVSLGSADTTSPYFFREPTLTVAGDGRIIVLDNTMHEIRAFDREGQLLWRVRDTYPRIGFLRNAAVSGDSILVFHGSEAGPDRMSLVVAPAGETRTPARVSMAIPGAPAGSRPWAVLRGVGGWLLLTIRQTQFDSAGLTYSRVNHDIHEFELPSREIGRLVTSWQTLTPSVRRGGTTYYSLLRERSYYSASVNSVFTTHAASVTALDAAGTQVRRIELRSDRRSVPAAWADSILGDYAKAGDDAVALRRLYATTDFPAIGGIWASQDGALAVLRSDMSERPYGLDTACVVQLFDARGRPLRTVRLPGGFRPSAFDGERLIGFEPDSTLVLPMRRENGKPWIGQRLTVYEVQ